MKKFLLKAGFAIIFLSFPRLFANESISVAQLGFLHSKEHICAALNKNYLTNNEKFLLSISLSEKTSFEKKVSALVSASFREENFSYHNNFDEALNVLSSKKEKSRFYTICVSRLVSIFFNQKKYYESVKLFNLIQKTDSYFYRKSGLLAANAYLYINRKDSAEKVLTEIMNNERGCETALLVQLRLAHIKKLKNENNEALNLFLNVMNSASDWRSDIASNEIINLIKNKKAGIEPKDRDFLLQELLKRNPSAAFSLVEQKNQIPVHIRLEFFCSKNSYNEIDNLAAEFPSKQNKIFLDAALYFYEKNDYKNAVKFFLKCEKIPKENVFAYNEANFLSGKTSIELFLKESTADNVNYAKYMFKHAISMASLGKNTEAGDILKKISKSYPQSRYAERALYSLIFLSEKMDKDSTKILIEKFPNSFSAASAEEFLNANAETASDNLLFFHPLKAIKEKPSAIQISEDFPEKNIQSNIASFFDGGDREGLEDYLNYIKGRNVDEGKVDSFLFNLSVKYGITYLSCKYADNSAKKQKLSFNSLSKQDLMLLFPRPFDEQVTFFSFKYGVPKSLVFAIMKSESFFDPRAKSPAGATGLMQIMPATARQNADKIAMKNYSLFDPEDSINIGVYHLSVLFKRNNCNIIKTAAEYNAGTGNAKKWFAAKNSLPDLEKIQFAETRDYAEKVGLFYLWYVSIYGEK